MKAYRIMLKNELKLSLRGIDMLIFAIVMPIVVLVVLGIIYGTKPPFEGADYTMIQQSFGALSTIAICAGGVMGLPLVVSDYRAKHILKRYKVTPIRPITILIVEVTIYIIYAAVSLISLIVVARLFFSFRLLGSWFEFLLGWIFVMVSMFSIGLMVGGIAKDSKVAGVIASALYFPMLIFSGATLPYEIMPDAMQKIVNILPLTQGIKILKSASLGTPLEHIGYSVIILILITLICSFIGVKYFKWE